MKQRGQSTLYAILLMPILMMVLALVADVGSLQVQSIRLRWAQDMALVDAVTEIDAQHYSATGQLRIAPSAVSVYQQYLEANLESMKTNLGNGETPRSIAEHAEIVVVNDVPGTDPFSHHRLDRPAICARLRAPIKTSLLRLAGLESAQTLTVPGTAQIRGDVR